MKDKKKILFVCLGNICRSSSAEGVMKHLIEQAGREDEFVIDSAGILSYHQGELPDSRMCAHAARRGYNLTHRSRPVRTDEFYNFGLKKQLYIEKKRVEKDTPHDSVLYQVHPCRPCSRSLVRRSRGL